MLVFTAPHWHAARHRLSDGAGPGGVGGNRAPLVRHPLRTLGEARHAPLPGSILKRAGRRPAGEPEPRGVRHPSAHAEERMARAASVTVPSGDAAASPFEGKARKPRSRPSDREPCPSAGMRSSSCLTRCRSVSRVARRKWSPRRWPTSFTISRTRRRSDPARHSPRGRAEPARLCRRPRRRTTPRWPIPRHRPDRTEPRRSARRAELGADRLGQRALGHRAGLQPAANPGLMRLWPSLRGAAAPITVIGIRRSIRCLQVAEPGRGGP
jgi:hypothetical protein